MIKFLIVLGISVQDVSLVYPNRLTALSKLTIDFEEGDFISVLGPSGCGKSSFLRLLAGLETPAQGQIRIRESIRKAFVFQDACLLPWRTVIENVKLPLELTRSDPKLAQKRAEDAINLVGLKDFASAFPNQLSGGMKMRASLARALVTEPELLLLDEPFGALDEMTRLRLDLELRQLWAERKMTVIFVTHSVSEAVFLSNRVVILSKRPGRVLIDQKSQLPDRRSSDTRLSPLYLDQLKNLSSQIEEQG